MGVDVDMDVRMGFAAGAARVHGKDLRAARWFDGLMFGFSGTRWLAGACFERRAGAFTRVHASGLVARSSHAVSGNAAMMSTAQAHRMMLPVKRSRIAQNGQAGHFSPSG